MDICLNCNGAIGQEGVAYGYAGKWCHCPVNPISLYQRPASKERRAKLEPIYDAVYETGLSFLNAQDGTEITELELLKRQVEELEKDRQRLNWLIEEFTCYNNHEISGWLLPDGRRYGIKKFSNARAAIDSAMVECDE